MTEELSVWLLPCRDDRSTLAEKIDNLAHQYSSPRFVPHVTVLGPLTAEISQASERLRELASQFQPFDVLTTGVSHGPARFKAVFIEVAVPEGVQIMRSRLTQLWPEAQRASFHPHISLIYKPLAESDRKAIAVSVTAARSYSFDEIAIVIPGGKCRDWLDVESWRTVVTYKLGDEVG